MKRRQFVHLGLSAAIVSSPFTAFGQSDKWGASLGYPTGWEGGFSRNPAYRVGNYSGGYESMVRTRRIGARGGAAPLTSTMADLKFRRGSSWAAPAQYLDAWPVTGLLI